MITYTSVSRICCAPLFSASLESLFCMVLQSRGQVDGSKELENRSNVQEEFVSWTYSNMLLFRERIRSSELMIPRKEFVHLVSAGLVTNDLAERRQLPFGCIYWICPFRTSIHGYWKSMLIVSCKQANKYT